MKLNLKTIFQEKENVYLVLALVFGMFMVFLNPPFAGVPDEGAHYLRAANIAQGNILCSDDGKIRKASYDLADEIKPIKINGSNDQKISLGKIKKALLEKDSQEIMQFGGANCVANPLGYFPQVMGIKIADLLNAPVLWGFYLARLLNLLLSVIIVYFAIKILPFGKIIFLLIALLPMTIQQFASISYDPLNISLIFIFTAFVLRLATGEGKISNKQLFWLALSAIFAANIKWGFLPIMLLLFVLPKGKFKNNKHYWLYIISVIFISSFIFLLSQLNTVSSAGPRGGSYPTAQAELVLKNPITFLTAVVDTIYIDMDFFVESFSYKPGWLNFRLQPIFYIITLLGLIVLIRSEKENVNLTAKQRIILGTTFLFSLLFIFFSLYIFWSKVGGNKVQGVQGRYLLSVFPLLLIAFYKSNFHFRFEWIRKNMEKVIAIFIVIIFLISFNSIWKFYYDKSENIGKYIYESYVSLEQNKNAEAVKVQGIFEQTFLIKKDEFLGVKIFVQKNVYNGKATFYLKDASCNETLRKKEIEWKEDEFGSVEIKFGIVSDSKNEKFCLQGELTPGTELAIKTTDNLYQDGELKINGNEQETDIIFDLMYEN